MSKGLERREFLKVLGVTGAGASVLSGCRPNGSDKLIPYVIPHEDIVPGVSTWYHTTCRECPAGCGMSVRTREGRAIKAEGNPLSPISHGKLCARGQASLHGLYDPDRIPQPLVKNAEGWDPISWDDAEQRVANALIANRGRTVLLTHTFTGTLDRLIDDWCTAHDVQRVRYEPFALEALRAGYGSVLGGDAVPVHDFSKAEVVVTFGADFLETWISPIDYATNWVSSHAYRQGTRGKLISVTPHQSLTDMNADEWLPIRPGTEHIAALAIARLIGGSHAALNGPETEVNAAAQTCGISPDRLRAVAKDFARNGRSLAVGPGISSSHRAATAVAAAVAILNQAAGNIGQTVNLAQREEHTRTDSYRAVQDVIARMRSGQVTALLVYGPNPVYSMPEHEAVRDALKKAAFVASFNSQLDETSEHAHVLLPDHHFLESWGDYVPRTGIISVIQPVMTSVFNTKQTGDALLSIATRTRVSLPDAASTFYDYMRNRWLREVLPGAGEATGSDIGDDPWREALKAGVVTTTTAVAQAPRATPAAPQINWSVPTFSGDGEFHLIVYPSYKYYDGRLANRPWLQELPDPVSKFTWASWIEISPAAAKRLDLDNGHLAIVRTEAGATEPLPIFIHPGTRDDVIALQLGQGHTQLGRYAEKRGANAFHLLQAEPEAVSGGLVFIQAKAHLIKTGTWERPSQHSLHDGQANREIAQAITLSSAKDADAKRLAVVAHGGTTAAHSTRSRDEKGEERAGNGGGHGEEDGHPYDARVHQLQGAGGMTPVDMDASPAGYPQTGMYYGEYTEQAPRWGMAIDLEKCIGCSACVTACYAENNIGIVGPQQIAMGRILHWIRIERYFEHDAQRDSAEDTNGSPAENWTTSFKGTRFLPMTCQHCGNAPCEPVCPVYAAYHTPDGLNAQVYNRCVGTRYCSNNCPYKVRVFNWFTWEWPEPLNWQLNPDVTVREKGVMEKCTFCVQRIREAQNHARLEDRAVTDGEITPACAQTCPGEAIVFGNVKDPNSRVARVAASGRGYRVLEELNTQSAITYLKRVELD